MHDLFPGVPLAATAPSQALPLEHVRWLVSDCALPPSCVPYQKTGLLLLGRPGPRGCCGPRDKLRPQPLGGGAGKRLSFAFVSSARWRTLDPVPRRLLELSESLLKRVAQCPEDAGSPLRRLLLVWQNKPLRPGGGANSQMGVSRACPPHRVGVRTEKLDTTLSSAEGGGKESAKNKNKKVTPAAVCWGCCLFPGATLARFKARTDASRPELKALALSWNLQARDCKALTVGSAPGLRPPGTQKGPPSRVSVAARRKCAA